jgi:hypothetical protein
MKRALAFLFVLAICVCVPAAAAVAASAPSIAYGTPDPIRNEEATLHFTIDPQGLDTEYEVEWAQVGNSFTVSKMSELVSAGEEPVAQEVTVPRYWEGDGLYPGREYHWRVRAWNAEGETIGPDQFFTTTDGPNPGVEDVSAVQTGEGTVELTATVNPEGVPLTSCEFRYADQGMYYHGFDWHDAIGPIRIGPTVPCEESLEEIGSGTEPVAVHAQLTGLHAGKWYFRVEADNQYESSALLVGTPFEVVAPFSPPVPPVTPPSDPPEGAPGHSGAPPADTPGAGPPAEVPAGPKPCDKRRSKHKRNYRHGPKHARQGSGHGLRKACGRSA